MIRLKTIHYGFAFVAMILLTGCTSIPAADTSINDLEDTQESQPIDLDDTIEPTLTPTDIDVSPQQSLIPDDPPPAGMFREFSTDVTKHSVPFTDILSGGPPKDGIPAIDNPVFIRIEEADEWLSPREPVILFDIGDDARAYPLQILTYHEIVNDVVGGVPVVVTFCPLCNTAIAFESTVDGRVLDFGTTGRLRFSNLLMYDRQTESWWQQATGDAVVGEFTGTQLTFLPAVIISWEEFRTRHPDGQVLSRDTGFSRPYGRNPYGGYDDVRQSPFLYRGPATPGILPPVARVITLDLNGEAVAYPYEVLENVRVVNDHVGGIDVAVFWAPGTASALDSSSIADSRDVGAATAFNRKVGDVTLSFQFDGSDIVDDQTGSRWNVLGQAISGELAGEQLEPVVAINHFWFSWAAFKPETRVYTSPDQP